MGGDAAMGGWGNGGMGQWGDGAMGGCGNGGPDLRLGALEDNMPMIFFPITFFYEQSKVQWGSNGGGYEWGHDPPPLPPPP